jgi:hypothetical protein
MTLISRRDTMAGKKSKRRKAECKIFVSLFRCFGCFERNKETAKQLFWFFERNSETVVAEKTKNETVSLFRFDCFDSEKMVLDHIFWADLLYLSRCSRKIENFGNKINYVLERIQTLSTDIVESFSC